MIAFHVLMEEQDLAVIFPKIGQVGAFFLNIDATNIGSPSYKNSFLV